MKKGRLTTVIFVLIFIVGLSLLLYPTVANSWNSMHATKTITSYTQSLENITETESQQMWQAAVAYNEELAAKGITFSLSPEKQQEYDSLLNLGDSGVMGYIEIEKINVTLPVYHGTSEGVLQIAAGHVNWSSLPVGGLGSHCVLSGHRGLPSAKLFTDVDELIPGDQFTLVIMGNSLTYEVDQIRTVLPTEVQALTIDPSKDYCTLVTCTPYGINTHRLLIRGHRVASASEEVQVISEAVIIDPMIVAPILSIPLLLLFLVTIFIRKPKKRHDMMQTDSSVKTAALTSKSKRKERR